MSSEALFKEVQAHLAEVAKNPSTFLNESLLEKFNLHFFDSIDEVHRNALINQLAELIPNLQQNPQPTARLIEQLIRPPTFTFDRVLAIRPTIDFSAGLSTPSSVVNIITLCLLEKACHNQSDSNFVAGKPELVAALVRLWLCTPDINVAEKAQNVLLALLGPIKEIQDTQHQVSENLMWRRVFRDRNIYDSILSTCSLNTIEEDGQLQKKDKTIAQARLLDFLLQINCSEFLWYSSLPDLEKKYNVDGGGGLLEFAAVHMIDFKDDVLMHVTLIEFFAKLLIMTPFEKRHKALDFLIHHGLHARTISYYLEPDEHDSIDVTFLYGCSARYLSVYCSHLRSNFLSTRSTVDSALKRLSKVLSACSTTKLASGQVLTQDLQVLTSLPRSVLLQHHDDSGILFQLGSKLGNAELFSSLATIFRGPENGFEASEEEEFTEKAAARALYFLYLEQFPELWKQVVRAANTIAIEEAALAAIGLIRAVTNANWALSPSVRSGIYGLPTEEELTAKCHSTRPMAQYGVEAIINSKDTIDAIIPYLLAPTQIFGNSVGTRVDTENALYEVAVAKHEALIILNKKLGEIEPTDMSNEFLGQKKTFMAAISRRIADGPLGGNIVAGGVIATREL